MDDKRGKYIPPSINETAFNCPHCNVLAKQTWFKLAADPHKKDDLPKHYSEDQVAMEDLKEMDDT